MKSLVDNRPPTLPELLAMAALHIAGTHAQGHFLLVLSQIRWPVIPPWPGQGLLPVSGFLWGLSHYLMLWNSPWGRSQWFVHQNRRRLEGTPGFQSRLIASSVSKYHLINSQERWRRATDFCKSPVIPTVQVPVLSCLVCSFISPHLTAVLFHSPRRIHLQHPSSSRKGRWAEAR